MVVPDDLLRSRYSKVLSLLHDINFQYIEALDENRLKDGIYLRYHFSCACNIPYDIINNSFDNNTCSVLEMMASLAKRCEDDIMSDNNYGDRTYEWFALMFHNLGLDMYDDLCWTDTSYYEVMHIINNFMFRKYNRDGSNGNIFITNNPNIDLRNIQIWDQMCMCMTQILGY